MGEQIVKQEELLNKANVMQVAEDNTLEPSYQEASGAMYIPATVKSKFTKKKLAILATAVVALIAITIIAIVFLVPSKFESVRSECVQIAGQISGSGDYFRIDTYPDEYANMDAAVVAMLHPTAQSKALEAIKYANEELGFNGSVYSRMLDTTALMGRQSVENDKYRVSWTYHPDDGLEVTYEKK